MVCNRGGVVGVLSGDRAAGALHRAGFKFADTSQKLSQVLQGGKVMGEKYVRQNRDGSESIVTPGRGECRIRRDSKGIATNFKQVDNRGCLFTLGLIACVAFVLFVVVPLVM